MESSHLIGKIILEKFLKIVGWVLGSLVAVLVILSALFAYWYLRPNRAHVDTGVVTDSWDIANDGMHNSNTGMIEWQGKFYISYVSSPFHFGSVKSVLHVKVSTDVGHKWLEVNNFSPYGEDIRDPKFAVIGNRLFLYALKNTSFVAEPYITVYSYTEDGAKWTSFTTVPGLDGWLFWRPKTQDGVTFYNAAYWFQHDRSVLLKSTDGINWQIISTIHSGDRNDETEIQFLPDGRLLATARLEYGVLLMVPLVIREEQPSSLFQRLLILPGPIKCRAISPVWMALICSPTTTGSLRLGATNPIWVTPVC